MRVVFLLASQKCPDDTGVAIRHGNRYDIIFLVDQQSFQNTQSKEFSTL